MLAGRQGSEARLDAQFEPMGARVSSRSAIWWSRRSPPCFWLRPAGGLRSALRDTDLQNIYDNPEFFAGYSQMERFGSGWVNALEQPWFLRLLPELAGMRALDLGCGAGQLSQYLATSGATEVVAVDISETMIGLARAERAHPRVRYEVCAIERLEIADQSFDLVVSSLAFHYVADYCGLVRNIALWLRPGGILVYSTEHPIYTARLPGPGWGTDDSGQRIGWQIDHYFEEGPRLEKWFVGGVRKYHRTLSTLLDGVVDGGLRLERVIEPAPDANRLRLRPYESEHLRRPMFLLVRASRPH
jgi:SAM-dependent methyltransferase